MKLARSVAKNTMFPVLATALAERVGDDVEHCQQCARAVAPAKKFNVTHR